MDLTLPIAYNGLTTGLTTGAGGAPASGTVFTRVDFSAIPTDGYLDKRALQDGLDASDVYLGGRTITIQAAAYGSTHGHTWDQAQRFMRVFSPRHAYDNAVALLGFRPLQFYQPTSDTTTWPLGTYPNGIPLQIYARPTRAADYVIERSAIGSPAVSALGGKLMMQANLIARDPRKYVQTALTSTITASAQTATDRGDAPSFPVITFSLSATGHSALRFFVGGNYLELNVSTISSGTYSADYAQHTITKSDGVLHMELLSQAQAYNQIQPDDSTTFYMTNSTGVSSATITYSEAFF